MRAILAIIIVMLAAAPAMATDTRRVPTNKCTTPQETDIDGNTNGDVYWDIGYTSNAEASPVSIFFDPDITGAGTGETLTISACMVAEDSNTCWDLLWDTDANGVPDSNILTGTTAATSGLSSISGFPYLRIQETGTPSVNARYVICRGF